MLNRLHAPHAFEDVALACTQRLRRHVPGMHAGWHDSPKTVTMRPKMMQNQDAQKWMLEGAGFLTMR